MKTPDETPYAWDVTLYLTSGDPDRRVAIVARTADRARTLALRRRNVRNCDVHGSMTRAQYHLAHGSRSIR